MSSTIYPVRLWMLFWQIFSKMSEATELHSSLMILFLQADNYLKGVEKIEIKCWWWARSGQFLLACLLSFFHIIQSPPNHCAAVLQESCYTPIIWKKRYHHCLLLHYCNHHRHPHPCHDPIISPMIPRLLQNPNQESRDSLLCSITTIKN